MKRFIFKLSFVPKLPIAHAILDSEFSYDGSFYLISEKALILTDFFISEVTELKGTCVHISHTFEAFLNSNEMEQISITHAHFSQYLASNMYSSLYTDFKLYLIPIMKKKDMNEWKSTLEWIKHFTDPPLISVLYQKILVRFDKKNQGEKLREFFIQNGEEINRFIHFIMSLEIPVKDFIKSNPPIHNQKLTNQEFVARFTALKFQELIVNRITKKEHSRRNQYSIIRSVAYNLNLNILNKTKRNYIKFLECDDTSDLKQSIPLLDIVDISTRNVSMSEYPLAFSRSHQRILEVLENRDLMHDIHLRIPDNFKPPDPTSLHPMELSYLAPIAPIHLFIAYLFNRISDQFYPVTKGNLSVTGSTVKVAEIISNILLYRFKDLRLLRIALTDTTLATMNRKSLPNNTRLVSLGGSVLNFIVSDLIFLANKNESVIRMTKLRSLILGGEFFRNVANKMSLGKNFISSYSGPTFMLPNHTAKKIIQAIFGAMFLDSNLSTCFTSFKYLLMIDDKALAESMFNLSPIGLQTLDFITRNEFGVQNDNVSNQQSSNSVNMSINGSNDQQQQQIVSSHSNSSISSSLSNPQLNSVVNPNAPINSAVSVISSLLSEFPEYSNHPIKLQSVCDVIKISFPSNYLPIFQAAFTHSSCSKLFTSNERLVFVGESFTRMIITMLAYRCFPTCDSDQLDYVIYEKMKQLGLICYDKRISTITVVQPGFEDKLEEPSADDDEGYSSLHSETLFAIVAAILFACGFNTAYQFLHQDILGLNWFSGIDVENFKQKEIEEKIRKKAGVLPHYFQYLVDGRYYTLMSVGNFRVPCVGVAKDPIVSKMDLINAVEKTWEEDPSTILTQKEYDDLELNEADDEFPQLQYTTYD